MLPKTVKLYYPSARDWMWNYCIYLGPYTDSKGANYDLGFNYCPDCGHEHRGGYNLGLPIKETNKDWQGDN